MNGRRLLRWVRQAAREFGWRDAAIAVGLIVFFLTFSNSGGYLLVSLTEGTNPIFDPAKTYGKTLLTGLLGRSLPLVFTIRVAELAIADGVRPWRAYLAALLVTLACSQAVLHLPIGTLNRSTQHVGRELWFLIAFGFQLGTAVVVYALWRSSQRTTERVRASEAARAHDLQRLQSAELLALQARVDPQLLFDALGRVGVLQRRDPPAADRLLTNLIAMLRAMLPRWAVTGSTVEREFAVVRSWLQVTRALAPGLPSVEVALDDRTGRAALAPMLALPMLRSVLDAPGTTGLAWRLVAEAAAGRLLVTLATDDRPADPIALDRIELGPLRERLALLHGDAARLWVTGAPPRLVLDLPLADEPLAEPVLRAAA
jgi:hypothetical protein